MGTCCGTRPPTDETGIIQAQKDAIDLNPGEIRDLAMKCA